MRYLLVIAALLAPIAAGAQQRVGPLDTRNNLAEIAGGGANAQAAARTNLGLPASAATDTTNAANITAGTLSLLRLPSIPFSLLSGNPSSAQIVGGLGFTPYSAANPSGFVNAAGAASAAPVQSVFGRSGAVSLQSSDVTGALGFTPYAATNPNSYVNAAGAASAAPVQTVAGRSGSVTLSTGDISGLGSIATQSAASVAVTGGTIAGATVGASTVTVTGGTPRALSVIEQDVTNILNVLPQTSSGVDYTAAINAAIVNAPIPVYLPNTGASYKISAQILLRANSSIICQPGATIELTQAVSIALNVSGANAAIRDCQFKGGSFAGILLYVGADNFSWVGGGADHAGYVQASSTNARIDRVKLTNGTSMGVNDFGGTHTSVTNSEFQNMASFGIFASSGASKFYYAGNRTDGNAIELIGVDYTAHSGQVIGNRAEGTGDNGISITGYDNVVTGNLAYHCAFGGVVIYGSRNVVTGNKGTGNGQIHNPASPFYNAGNVGGYGGITLTPMFGGAAQSNVVTGNFGDDDQTTMTQAYDLNITGSIYANWTASTAQVSGTYIYFSNGTVGNIYKYTASGTSGTTAPTFTSGSQADGTATLTFVGTTPANSREPSMNVVGPNHYERALIAPHFDGTVVHNNAVITDAYQQFNGGTSTGGSATLSQQYNTIYNGFASKVTTGWSNGMTVTYGQLVYNGTNTYRSLSAGTSTVQPTCSSGTCTTGADSIGWMFIIAGNVAPTFAQTGKITEPLAGFALPVVESATAICPEYAGTGSPLGKVVAPICATYRRSDGGAGTTFYVKESGVDSSGWVGK